MANPKRAQYTLITIVILLFVGSFAMSIGAGISPQKALIDNSLDSLQVGYNVIQFAAAENPLFLASRLLNAAIFPILTVILAVWFFDFINSINLREGLAISRIKKLKNYVIVVPYNSFAKTLVAELKGKGMKAVIIVESKKELLHLYKENELAVVGDLRSIETFEIAGIDRARCVVACGWDDVQNALVSITAKTARPDIEVFARANKEENVERLEKSGAYKTILVESTAGKEIGDEIAKRVLSKSSLKNI